jgi:hypothetical protein
MRRRLDRWLREALLRLVAMPVGLGLYLILSMQETIQKRRRRRREGRERGPGMSGERGERSERG